MFDESNGTARVQGTIIANNTGQYGSPDVAGAFVSLGQNLIGNPAGGTGFTTADIQNVNPMLGPLMLSGRSDRDDGSLARQPRHRCRCRQPECGARRSPECSPSTPLTAAPTT